MNSLYLIFILYTICFIVQAENLRSEQPPEISTKTTTTPTIQVENEINISIIDTLSDTFTRVSRRLEQWNRFKSYQHSSAKPPMYSKTSKHHDVSEYLSPVQKYMVNHQKHNYAGDRFGNKWSGYQKGGREE